MKKDWIAAEVIAASAGIAERIAPHDATGVDLQVRDPGRTVAQAVKGGARARIGHPGWNAPNQPRRWN